MSRFEKRVPWRAVYLAILDESGHKAVLGLWLGEHEGLWLNVERTAV